MTSSILWCFLHVGTFLGEEVVVPLLFQALVVVVQLLLETVEEEAPLRLEVEVAVVELLQEVVVVEEEPEH